MIEDFCLECGNDSLGNGMYCSTVCEDTSSARLQPLQSPNSVQPAVTDAEEELNHRSIKLAPQVYISRRLKPISKLRSIQHRDADSVPPLVDASPDDGTAPGLIAAELNESKLKFEGLLGNPPMWINAWRHDVGEYSPTVHSDQETPESSTPKMHRMVYDTSAASSDVGGEANSHRRPLIRSRHSCPADVADLRPKVDTPTSKPTSLSRRPSMLLSLRSSTTLGPVTDLTPALRAPVSFFEHDPSPMTSPALSSVPEESPTQTTDGAITTPSTSPSSAFDNAKPKEQFTSFRQLQARFAPHRIDDSSAKRGNMALDLVKQFMKLTHSTPSLSEPSDAGQVNLHISPRSHVALSTTPRAAAGRPRAHTTSYEQNHKLHFTCPASPTLTATIPPPKTPTDGISVLNLSLQESAKAERFTNEQLLQSMDETREAECWTKDTYWTASDDHHLPKDHEDRASRLSLRSGPIPVPEYKHNKRGGVIRGRPRERNFDILQSERKRTRTRSTSWRRC